MAAANIIQSEPYQLVNLVSIELLQCRQESLQHLHANSESAIVQELHSNVVKILARASQVDQEGLVQGDLTGDIDLVITLVCHVDVFIVLSLEIYGLIV